MIGSSDESSISNMERIQMLKDQLKNADSLYPKSPNISRNVLQTSTNPIEDSFHQPSKKINRTPANQN